MTQSPDFIVRTIKEASMLTENEVRELLAEVWDEGFVAAREWAAGGREQLRANPYQD